ncbi:GntR family transcriptional regulator [Parasphingorhabdus cellanae]|uniref:GntR family transcriptional regulator n=1 Tax=Parasphingorhabdus cellanae TaxID=2806553 RepID=A0ABX7T6R7_9SPHN|nr:GntR family transcriptional regulator [Parasphingorhabdus cellanae]QTD57278.1 GntR family transcriptional regulator [Parasphingorhabdus cellanae]
MKTPVLVKDRNSGLPQYLVIAETIRSWIQSGRYKAGDSIATIGELAREFKVAKGTIQEALRELSDNGIIITSRGRRSRVGSQPEIRPVFGDITTKDLLLVETSGDTPSQLASAKIIKPSKKLSKMFEFEASQRVAEYRSLLYLNGRPNGYSIVYVSAGKRTKLLPLLSHDDFKIEVRDRIDNAARSERHVAATTADIEMAHLLDIPVGSPILRYSCAMWNSGDEFLIYFINFLRSDGCEYRLDT